MFTRPLTPCILLIFLVSAVNAAPRFLRGDANQDGKHDLSDAILILSYLFTEGKADCLDALDVNDDGANQLSDPIYLLTYLFTEGPPPPAPFLACGEDPTPDGLGCTAPNPEVCRQSTLRIDSVTPVSGSAEGGEPLVITGEGFSAVGLATSLCDHPLIDLAVIDDGRIEALTPPGVVGTACTLNASTQEGSFAILENAFLYTPPCRTEAAISALAEETFLAQPQCEGTGIAQLELDAIEEEWANFGLLFDICPLGWSNTPDSPDTCWQGIESIDCAVDFEAQTITFTFYTSIQLYIDITFLGELNQCEHYVLVVAMGTANLVLQDTEFPGIRQIADLTDLNFTVIDTEESYEGGELCATLHEVFVEAFAEEFEVGLNDCAPESEQNLADGLVDLYICD